MREEVSEKLMLSYAICMAVEGHQGQFDKAGMPYILHPAGIALKLMELGYGPKYQAVAWLHDYMEDVSKGVDRMVFIRHHISDDVVDAIELVSNLNDDEYSDFIDRIVASNNKMAIVVKIYDMKNNLGRMNAMAAKDPVKALKLTLKYTQNLPKLEEALKSL
jgi:(p)ppGpp synthase/HD superfamily hydrolase